MNLSVCPDALVDMDRVLWDLAKADDAVVLRFSRRRNHARGGLKPSLLIGVGRVLFNPARARQHHVGGLDQRRQHHGLDREERQLARFARLDYPAQVANRAFRPRIDDIQG